MIIIQWTATTHSKTSNNNHQIISFYTKEPAMNALFRCFISSDYHKCGLSSLRGNVINPFMPTVPTFAVRETDVSRHNGGTSGAPLKPLRDDSALRALSSLRGLRGAPEVPPLCRETQSLGQQMLELSCCNATKNICYHICYHITFRYHSKNTPT